MSYTLKAKNKELDHFEFGAFSWPILLEACGYLFPSIHKNGKWCAVFGTDSRFPDNAQYPGIIANDGFRVTADEARIMARIARNFVNMQWATKATEDNAWPVKIREDFTDRYEAFAEWAIKSGGFTIW